jgi:hypothetical protein
MPRSRRLKEKVENTGGLPDGYAWCRKCGKIGRLDEFYPTTDPYLDAALKVMSICRSCCNDIFVDSLKSESSLQAAVLKTCKMINLKYDESAIDAALKDATSKERDFSIGMYKAKIMLMGRSSVTEKASDMNLTYQDNPIVNMNLPVPSTDEVDSEVVTYWGEGYETKDYEWLEKMLDEWKRSHKCDNKAEETLLREIVFKQFEIEKARQSQSSTASLVKELQDLLKTANVDPAKAALANSGKAQETFSSFIRMIEENEPASYYSQEDRKLFKDFDNIEWYFDKYVRRPLKNFIIGSRDFNVEGESEDDDDVGENTDIDSVETGE